MDNFEKINSILKTNSDVTTFIKDFILRFRFADLALNSIEHFDEGSMLSFTTTHQMCSAYGKAANKIIRTYNDSIRRKCNPDNIKPYCEKEKLSELKKSLDDEKNLTFEKIINQYNSIDSFGYNSGRLSDFMIYGEYLDYITSDDFYYDDQNPYIVELFHDINDFLRIREKIENNGTNIADMIIQFNSMCDDVLSGFWDSNVKDYYGRMKEIFLYDFYADSESDLIEAKIDDDNRVTLYKKVLDYLKVLTRYTAPVSGEKKYESLDVQTIINMGDAEEDDNDAETKKLNKLKKIAITFVSLRKIETGTDPSFFEKYMNEEDINSIFTLSSILQTMNMTLKDYTAACAVDPSLLAYSEVMKKYQGMIKGITDDESKTLRELSDRAISWYKENAERIDSGKIFEELNEISWPSPTIIKKDGKTFDFYFIEHRKDKTSDEATSDSSDWMEDYPFSTNSLYTRHGIDSMNYWLRYCAVATMANCMLPMYWSTGLIVGGSPVKLPIIFIPIIVLSKRIITVIGIGLCGICPLPMILFMNVGDVPGYAIPTLNVMVDKLKSLPAKIVDKGNDLIKSTLKWLINAEDEKINSINSRISDINAKIRNLNTGVQIDRETERNVKKRNNINPTTNAS